MMTQSSQFEHDYCEDEEDKGENDTDKYFKHV